MHFAPARAAVALFVAAFAAVLGGAEAAAFTMPTSDLTSPRAIVALDPGQFVWQPERAPDGEVDVVISLPEQLLHVRRGGVLIGISTISSGGPGYATPAGTFTILQKKTEHYSNLYDDAPMPYMQRLTWDGIALHAGSLPGYPASHGCVRLPNAFAILLYGATRHGSQVVVLDEDMDSDTWLQRELLVASAPVQGRGRRSAEDAAVERESAAATARLNRAMLAQIRGSAPPALPPMAEAEGDKIPSSRPRFQIAATDPETDEWSMTRR